MNIAKTQRSRIHFPAVAALISLFTVAAAAPTESVSRFVLVDAATNQDLGELVDGATLDLSELQATTFNIRAEVTPGHRGSVLFGMGQDPRFRVDSTQPYAVFGDHEGNYASWLAPAGRYELTATPFSEPGGNGTPGTPSRITFTVRAHHWDTMSDTWVAIDNLRRRTPGYAEAGPPRPDKTVAIFYYIWQGQHTTDVYDITKLLADNPSNPQWGPVNSFHWWGESIYGYYRATDDYVQRKNAQFLSDAGVDTIFFDTTNGPRNTYDAVVEKIGEVYRSIRANGGSTPQFAYLTNSDSGRSVEKIYNNFYSKGRFSELWFRWQGKPLILANPEEMQPEHLEFFTVRRSWAWSNRGQWYGDGEDKWPWLEDYPQKGGWHGDPSNLEQIVIASAQHPGGGRGPARGQGIGKSFSNGKQPPLNRQVPHLNPYFAEQWSRLLEVDPQLILITQWNEWLAQRKLVEGNRLYAGRQLQDGDTYFVDVYDMEFNRDLEPMKGGYEDNLYYQMVAGIRRFTGVRPLPTPSPPAHQRLGDWVAWERVQPDFRDDIGDQSFRDYPGHSGTVYRNNTGRNDIIRAKVARDAESVSFYVETSEPITPQDNVNWMMLFIGLEGRDDPDWAGFTHSVAPSAPGPDAPIALIRCKGGWDWETVGTVEHAIEGTRYAVRVPREMLGLERGATDVDMRFKWADNMQSPHPLDWTLNGDAAPNNRFAYHYRAPSQPLEN